MCVCVCSSVPWPFYCLQCHAYDITSPNPKPVAEPCVTEHLETDNSPFNSLFNERQSSSSSIAMMRPHFTSSMQSRLPQCFNRLTTHYTYPLSIQPSFSEQASLLANQQSLPLSPTPQNLNKLLRALLPVKDKWNLLGTLLECEEATLNSIERNPSPDTCLQKMLSHRLKQINPPLSWELVAEAVGHISEHQAMVIRSLYLS